MSHKRGSDMGKVKVIKEGYLTKQGGSKGGKKNWKKRWFVLKEGTLYYFRDEESGGPALGLMTLKGVRILDLSAEKVTPPAWVDTRWCFECKTMFSFTTRHHHCRHCGRSFCGPCSNHRSHIPKFGFNVPVRVCEHCFETVSKSLDASHYMSAAQEKRISVLNRRQSTKFTLPDVQKAHLFALKNSERELWVHADTEQERLEWVEAICSVRDADTSTPPPPRGPRWVVEYSQVETLKKVGSGSFGDVFKARLWGTDIALKKISDMDSFMEQRGSDMHLTGRAPMSRMDVLSDITKEIEILSHLRHPNVVLYIGACTRMPNVAILTEWCERGSLWDVLQDTRVHLNTQLIVELAMQIAQGMNYLHSLEHPILHRDLKSSNILVDHHLCAKVADFGLSSVRAQHAQTAGHKTRRRERQPSIQGMAEMMGSVRRGRGKTSASEAEEKYAVLGTPEWMAPEVMEGRKYNEKIDVYSYGVLLTELVTRRKPFHDTYNIQSYMDVVDAVLEDGALPTIPKWCDTFLRPLIEECLSRDPSARPSFDEIILKLREFSTMEKRDSFFQFDVPRLQEMLFDKQPSIQAMAASEIAALIREKRIARHSYTFPMIQSRVRPKKMQHGSGDLLVPLDNAHRRSVSFQLDKDVWVLDDDDAAFFLDRFTALLSSSRVSVQLHACDALAGLLSCADRPKKQLDRQLLIQNGAMTPLMAILGSSGSRRLVAAAGEALLQLTSDMKCPQLAGLNMGGLKSFEEIVRGHAQKVREELAEMQETLRQRETMLKSLSLALASGDEEAKQGADQEGMRAQRPKMMRGQRDRERSRSKLHKFKPPVARSQQGHPQMEVKSPNLETPWSVEVSGPERTRRPSPALQEYTAKFQEAVQQSEYPARNRHESRNEVPGVDNLIVKFEDKRGSTSLSVVREETQVEPTEEELSALAGELPDRKDELPTEWKEYYTFVVHFGYALRYDDEEKEWTKCFLLLGASELRVFGSHEEPPEDPLFIIRVRTPQGQPTKVQVGAWYEKPLCFAMEDCGYKWTFCARSKEERTEWVDALESGIKPASSGPVKPDITMLRKVSEESLPAHHIEYFGQIEYYGDLLLRSEHGRWERFFFLLVNGHTELKFFENAHDESDDCVGTLYLRTSEDVPVAWRAIGEVEDEAAFFSVSNRPMEGTNWEPDEDCWMLCARGEEARQAWLDAMDGKGEREGEVVPKTVDRATSSGLVLSGDESRVSINFMARHYRKTSMDKETQLQHLVRQFITEYGVPMFSGYLYRKRQFSNRWTLEYFIMHGPAIYNYCGHRSNIKKPQSVFFSCTASGHSFEVTKEPRDKFKRSFCFSIRNPGRVAYLAADSEETRNDWLDAIRQSVSKHI